MLGAFAEVDEGAPFCGRHVPLERLSLLGDWLPGKPFD